MYANITSVTIPLASTNGSSISISNSDITEDHVVIESCFTQGHGLYYSQAQRSASASATISAQSTKTVEFTCPSPPSGRTIEKVAFSFPSTYFTATCNGYSVTNNTKYDPSKFNISTSGGGTVKLKCTNTTSSSRTAKFYLYIYYPSTASTKKFTDTSYNWTTHNGYITVTGSMINTTNYTTYDSYKLYLTLGVKE